MLPWFDVSQNGSIGLDMSLVAIYLVAIPVLKSREIYVCLLACIACQIYGLSPVYNLTLETNPSLVFLIYASIYFTSIRFLTTYKVIAACFIMALFEGLMYKAYLNELGHKGIEEGLYSYYEYFVTLLHLNILISMVRWDYVRRFYRSFRDNLLRPFLYERLLLPYRG